ncbi:MAG: glycosyltransferase family 87 protein [Candidatus Dormiibacterota bacterium]
MPVAAAPAVPETALRHWLRTRWRLAYLVCVCGVILYVARAGFQLVIIRTELPLQDFPEFYNAAVALNQGGDPYTAFISNCPAAHWCLGGYIYPTLFAELLRPLALLPVATAAQAWLLLSHLMLGASAVVAYRTVRPWLPRGAAPLLLAASLFFLPVYQNLHAAQIGALLLLVLTAAAWFFVRGQQAGGGLGLGLASVLRVSPVAMAPMLLRSRRDLARPWGIVVMGLTGLLLLAGLYLLTPATIEYFTEVLPRISAGTGISSNVSLPGVVERVQEIVAGRVFIGSSVFTVIVTLVGVGITWVASLRLDGARSRAAVFAAFLAVLPVVSSITWNYHLMNELLVYALLGPTLVAGSRAWWLAVASYPLVWIYADGLLLVFNIGTQTPLGTALFITLTSLNVVGAGLLWLACLDVLRLRRQRDAASDG